MHTIDITTRYCNSFRVNQENPWWKGWAFKIRRLFGWEDTRILAVTQAFNAFLEAQEAIPATLGDRAFSHLETAELLEQCLKSFSSKSLQEELLRLTQNKQALKYRSNELLSENYPEPLPFEWTNRALFAEFPALERKLSTCLLSERIARVGPDLLKIEIVEGKKVVTLPFDGIRYNILDETTEITFSTGLKAPLSTIFDNFKESVSKPSNFEIWKDRGICDWNPYQLCSHNKKLDLTDLNWWKTLPVFEELSLEKARELYQSDLDGKTWAVAAKSARATDDLSAENTHAFLEILVPENGLYKVYPFGKFVWEYPVGIVEKAFFLSKTIPAAILYPDENVFKLHRKQVCKTFLLQEEQGIALFEEIRKDLASSLTRTLPFQLMLNSCATWVQDKLEAVLGTEMEKIYRMRYLDVIPPAQAKPLFSLFKSLPPSWQTTFIRSFHRLTGSRQGMVDHNGKKHSLDSHPAWNESVFIVDHPPNLHLLVDGKDDRRI